MIAVKYLLQSPILQSRITALIEIESFDAQKEHKEGDCYKKLNNLKIFLLLRKVTNSEIKQRNLSMKSSKDCPVA